MNDKKYENYGLILPTMLEMTRTDIAYFSPGGNLIFYLGDTLTEGDFRLPNQVDGLLSRGSKPIKIHRHENGRTFLITYGLVKDRDRNTQGILLTKQDLGKEAADDGQSERGEGSERPAGVTRDQSLSALFVKYPGFRIDFFTLDEQLRGLDDPLALKMIQEATVGELAKSIRVDPDALIDKIQRLLDTY
jgi:hypothetical protein